MTPTSLRAGVVGAGLMGRWHAHAIRHVGGRVVALIDPDVERAERLAAQTPASASRRDRPRARASCAPDRGAARLHAARDARRDRAPGHRGRRSRCWWRSRSHRTQRRPRPCYRLAEARGVLLCPVHQFLFQPGILAAERAMATLGALRQLDVVACSAGADGRFRRGARSGGPRHPAARAGVGAAADRRCPGERGLARVQRGARRDSRDGRCRRHVGHARRVHARQAHGECPDGPLRSGDRSRQPVSRLRHHRAGQTLEAGQAWPAVPRISPGDGRGVGQPRGASRSPGARLSGPAGARSTVPPRLREPEHRLPSPSTNRSMWREPATSSAKLDAVGSHAPNSEAISRRFRGRCAAASPQQCAYSAQRSSFLDCCARIRARPCRRVNGRSEGGLRRSPLCEGAGCDPTHPSRTPHMKSSYFAVATAALVGLAACASESTSPGEFKRRRRRDSRVGDHHRQHPSSRR